MDSDSSKRLQRTGELPLQITKAVFPAAIPSESQPSCLVTEPHRIRHADLEPIEGTRTMASSFSDSRADIVSNGYVAFLVIIARSGWMLASHDFNLLVVAFRRNRHRSTERRRGEMG